MQNNNQTDRRRTSVVNFKQKRPAFFALPHITRSYSERLEDRKLELGES